jgi:hypothetical protein
MPTPRENLTTEDTEDTEEKKFESRNKSNWRTIDQSTD